MLSDYYNQLGEYVGQLNEKVEDGRLSVAQYDFLLDKLSEWMDEMERKVEGGEV